MAELANTGTYRLFRYRRVNSYLFRSLIRKEIYFAPPSSLNDPFDCQVNVSQAFEIAANLVQGQAKENLQKVISIPGFLAHVQAQVASIGVASFSLEIDNPTLWSTYADEHRGVCLLYEFPERFFIERADTLLGTDTVKYKSSAISHWLAETAPSIQTMQTQEFVMELSKILMTAKDPSWKTEGEYRILSASAGPHEIGKPFLKQVCFGLRTSLRDRCRIGEILLTSGYEVSLCEMERCKESDFGIRARPYEVARHNLIDRLFCLKQRISASFG
ncbi:MAG: DUF2971 domain-containing protein [Burkholderiales bacterium]|nr:DUF2971 domain-containing protein [Burkholderiales bacterium]